MPSSTVPTPPPPPKQPPTNTLLPDPIGQADADYLQKALKGASFSVPALYTFMRGGAEADALLHALEAAVAADAVFDSRQDAFLSRPDYMLRCVQRTLRGFEIFTNGHLSRGGTEAGSSTSSSLAGSTSSGAAIRRPGLRLLPVECAMDANNSPPNKNSCSKLFTLAEQRRALPRHGADPIGLLRSVTHNVSPLDDHFNMFALTLALQGTPSQQDEWLARALRLEIIGSFAQTELGHGSNLRGLQTTATYDPTTETFVMDTPCEAAAKWWPGGLGVFCTHAIVYAQLRTPASAAAAVEEAPTSPSPTPKVAAVSGVSGGTNGVRRYHQRGLHAFIVPLRDMATHRSLPGVDVGDIGPKMASRSLDNGFLLLKGVAIPRANLLARFYTVHPDGTYAHTSTAASTTSSSTSSAVPSPSTSTPAAPVGGQQQQQQQQQQKAAAAAAAAVTYATLLIARARLVGSCATSLGRGLQMALRFQHFRRQGFVDNKAGIRGGERVVADYPAQQRRLFPLVGAAYALWAGYQHLMTALGPYQQRLGGGGGSPGGGSVSATFAATPDHNNSNSKASLTELHAMSSGLKAFGAEWAGAGLEEARKCCGGFGYLMSSGIAGLTMDFMPVTTFEGDRTPMALQTARVLCGVIGGAVPAVGSLAYLRMGAAAHLLSIPTPVPPQDPTALASVVASWESIALSAAYTAATTVRDRLERLGKTPAKSGAGTGGWGGGGSTFRVSRETAWLEAQGPLVTAARCHTTLVLLRAVQRELLGGGGGAGAGVPQWWQRLLGLMGLGSAEPIAPAPTGAAQGIVPSAAAAAAVERSVCLFGLCEMLRLTPAESGIGPADAVRIEAAVEALLTALRPDALALVEGFGLPHAPACVRSGLPSTTPQQGVPPEQPAHIQKQQQQHQQQHGVGFSAIAAADGAAIYPSLFDWSAVRNPVSADHAYLVGPVHASHLAPQLRPASNSAAATSSQGPPPSPPSSSKL